MSGPLNRINVIDILERKHNLSRVITENICHYMESTRRYREGNNSLFVFWKEQLIWFIL